MRRLALLAASLLLAACAGPTPPASRLAPPDLELPPALRFTPVRPTPPQRANADMVHDIIELGFYMESGRPIPQFSRFDGPVTLFLTGSIPPGARAETIHIVERLRREAGLDITLAPAGATPTGRRVTTQFVPRAEMRRAVPQAACFLVPRVSSWEEFRRNRRSARLDWTTVVERDEVAVFIPADVSPQETRDCLHEEIAQAFGPLNDLYRLHESVFNDDNFQTILTGFDMLVLRAWNDPVLRPGMTRDAVAARLPAILARLNPAGEDIAPGPPPDRRPQAWQDAIETALGPGASRATRRQAAARALQIARDRGWQDSRLAFSYMTLGRLSGPQETDAALAAFIAAGLIYRQLPGAEAHLAHVDMQLAAFALSVDQPLEALVLARAAQPAARATQNGALLASLKLIEAEALDRTGRRAQAARVREEGLGWARFGFGEDAAVRARLADVTALGRPRAAPSALPR
ncbi:MAG: DUF2927 domain-containing protein [Alkalilacustris sp.]